MKAVILAGGMGSRISEESITKPKPLIEIAGMPIIWHIMKTYSYYGVNDFIICCGYKGHMIKQYFIDYSRYYSNIVFDLNTEKHQPICNSIEPWRITFVNTGLKTKTAGRLLKVKDYIKGEPFFLTYGDGVSDININELLEFHLKNGNVLTISTLQPEGRFGTLKIAEDRSVVEKFNEKARKDQSWINIGFMVAEPEIFEYLGDGNSMLEDIPFEALVAAKGMDAYKHVGFWSPMDTMKDKKYLEMLWEMGKAPWKIW